MVSSAESPVHENWKRAIVAAEDTGTVFLNQFSRPALRALRTEKTARLERELVPGYQGPPPMAEFARARELYFGGDMEASIALSGQVAGRIDSVKPVRRIIDETVAEFYETIGTLGRQYAP
jgi:enoyl-[acyl-carrier protein] reductase II